MGQELASAFPVARDTFAEADDVLGFSLTRLCWQGPEAELTATENAQPALLAHGTAVTRVLAGHDLQPVAASGHSLGEFTAHVAAGSLAYAEALRLVRARGRAMAEAGRSRPGTMGAIIGLDEGVIRALCAETTEDGEVLTPANFNSPRQIVISGSTAAVRRALDIARSRGARKAIELTVSGAFHSPLMEPAAQALTAALDSLEIRRAAIPVVANVDARAVREPGEIRHRLLVQLTAPVRWVECVESLHALGARLFLEPGPGRVLTGLLKRIDKTLEGRAVGRPEEVHEAVAA